MGNKGHREAYEEIRDGAITYFTKDLKDDVITSYQKSSIIPVKEGITVLINQRNTQRKVFLKTLQEFDELKASIEAEVEKEKADEEKKKQNGNIKIEEDIDELGNGEATITEENNDLNDGKGSDDDSATDNQENNKKDIDAKIKELEEKAKALEAMEEMMIKGEESVKNLKGSAMANYSLVSGIMREERVAYEQANDKLVFETAKHMIQKNVLVAKREVIVLEIQRAIKNEDENQLESLQQSLIDLNGRIDSLDQVYENKLPLLRADVDSSKDRLDLASRELKEVTKTVKVDFRNSYNQILRYNEQGILQSEALDMNVDLNRVIMAANYDENILSSGKNGALQSQTVNINGEVVRVLTQETSRGVDNSFLKDNTLQMAMGLGENNSFNTRDKDGDLIADNPSMQKQLKRIGLENVEDIEKARLKMDKDAEEQEQAKENGEYEEGPELYNKI